MKVADIARALEEVGKLKPNPESPRANYGTVYGTIRGDKRFVKTGTGEFGLSAGRLPRAVDGVFSTPED